jgi:two-component system phosphate regulon response regulator OmpR
MRILVIEDVAEMAELLREVLQGIPGVTHCALAAHGWDARLEISRRRPDLVLLDEILPGESSTDLLKEFNAEGIPVFLITGVSEPTHAIPEGVLGRLGKPAWRTLEKDRARIAQNLAQLPGFPGGTGAGKSS